MKKIESSEIYNDYDGFAEFYDKYWTMHIPELFEEALEDLLFSEIKKNSDFLELCCGTGNVANIISNRGYNVVGLDGSEEMIKKAKTKNHNVEFVVGDARNFKLNKKFQAVTCLFDSINHMLEENDVLKVFQSVYEHLDNNGIFIFDSNSENSLIESEYSDFTKVNDDSIFIVLSKYSKKTKLIKYNVTYLLKDNNSNDLNVDTNNNKLKNNGLWNRFDLEINERYYSNSKIEKLLKKAGFKNITYRTATSIGLDIFEDRSFWKAYK